MKKKKITIISGLLILILVAVVVVLSMRHNSKNEENVFNYLEEVIQSDSVTSEDIDKINEFLLDVDIESEYHFIKGYLEYLNEDYGQAVQSFYLASRKLGGNVNPLVNVYTYIFLNESLMMEMQYSTLAQNCNMALKYIAKDKNYRNDMNILWRVISVLNIDEESTQESIRILTDYLNNTNGLTNETRVRLLGNIGQLYSLVYRYSDAMYNYLDAMYLIESDPTIPNGTYYEIKLLSSMGDIIFDFGEYESAIEYYDEVLSIPLDDVELAALSKANPLINKCHVYIELGEYELAKSQANQLVRFLPYLEEDVRDDVEILMYNLLAQISTYQSEFEEAEQYLAQAMELLEHDSVEWSLDKYTFLTLTSATLFKEQKLYDQALETFEYVLTLPGSQGLEPTVYKQISEMYKEQQDLTNYIKYIELYDKEKDENFKILIEDYMEYPRNLHQSNLLQKQVIRYQIQLVVAVIACSIAGIAIFFRTQSVNKFRHLSYTDPMTTLYNRKYLDHFMEKNKKKLLAKDLSVVILDIDYFKKYNDNYGHLEGDQVIKAVAKILKDSVRRSDIVVRYGGEEMVLVLPEVSSKRAEEIVQRIQTSLKTKNIEHKYSEVSTQITVSIGIHTVKFSGQNVYDLINKADEALYRAKKGGRNRYEISSK